MTKVVLITGATSGIGEACAVKFAADGYDIILTGRNENKLDELKTTLSKYGQQVITLKFDVRDYSAAQKALQQLPDPLKQIDVLINNAGLALGLENEYEGNVEDWNTMIDTNIKGLLNMTRLIVPDMVKYRGAGDGSPFCWCRRRNRVQPTQLSTAVRSSAPGGAGFAQSSAA